MRVLISTNMWTRTNRKYFTNWLVQVYDNDELVFEHSFTILKINEFTFI
jgi:hypothetical protein